MCIFKFIFAVLTASLLASCSGNGIQKKNDKDELLKPSYYKVTVNDKAGFIDNNGKIIIEPQFDYTYDRFTEDVCYAEIGDRQGLINLEGNFVVELADSVTCVYDFVNGFAEYSCGYRRNGIMKYETPFIEIVKFEKENILLKASGENVTESIPDPDVNTVPTNPFD